MAIYQGVCQSFKQEILQAIHDLAGDTLKLALFTDSSNLSPLTTVYAATGEASGLGYTAGGKTVTASLVARSGQVEAVFSNVSWPASRITARGALIYNASKSNKAIAVLNFGMDRTSLSSTFAVVFPESGSDNPVLRVG